VYSDINIREKTAYCLPLKMEELWSVCHMGLLFVRRSLLQCKQIENSVRTTRNFCSKTLMGLK